MYTKEQMYHIRQELHQIPEEGFKEWETSKTLRHYLDNLDQKYMRIIEWQTGYFVNINGYAPEQTIGYRTDIDGLPMAEQTGLPYSSVHEGYMHACGHDLHMTIALSLLSYFSEQQPKDNLLFIFQPAEEGPGGAEPMIQSKEYEALRPDWMMALHVHPHLAVGTVATKEGLLFANTAEFNLHLRGKSGHAAYPHEANDMVVASSYLITQLQSVISRRIDPIDSAVISIGKLESGTKENIVASRASTEGTIRTLSKESMDRVQKHVTSMCRGIAESFDCEVVIEWGSAYKQVWNDATKTNDFINWTKKQPNVQFVESERAMTGEDFGFFLDDVPGFMFWLGVDGEAGLHEPTLNPKEEAIPVAVEHVIGYLHEAMNK
ncbi:N-acetyldiaminopimelate deacetylase [Geomicrobium sp. JSM 1781026]|uniref:N-acetyldiaminopimelate deacetylase n=1 Tax=Geomicrobium sp. JSM 1781026 TaxID=3344580 RepID=UPI0035BF7BBE